MKDTLRLLRPLTVGALAIASVLLAFWPATNGFWIRDDFMHLALIRVLGHPGALFVHDHYPYPGAMYRPLGFASLWASWKLLGTSYPLHALLDCGLHLAVATALFSVLRAMAMATWISILFALLFALHPSVLGTTLWWSDRFDLLATLFGLVALRASLIFLRRPAGSIALWTSLWALAALLSKETAVASCAAIALLWTRHAITDIDVRRRITGGLALLLFTVAGFFIVRASVLGTGGSAAVASGALLPTIGRGASAWLAHGPGYLFHATALQPAAIRWAFIGAIAALASAIALAVVTSRRTGGFPRVASDPLLIGGSLFVLPAILQAPIAVLNAASISDTSPAEFAMQSRLYYLSASGLVIMLAAFADAACRTAPARNRYAIAAALAGCGVVFAVASRQITFAYARETAQPEAMVDALIETVDRLDLPVRDCNVVVNGMVRPSAWDIYASADSIVKALATSTTSLGCYFDADYPTYYHILDRASLANGDGFRQRRGERHTPHLVGDSATLYLNPPPHPQTAPAPDYVLTFDGSGFTVEPHPSSAMDR